MAVVRTIEFIRTSLPLRVPYKLSFGPVRSFDTYLARIELDDGREGWGETTVLTGYTDETVEETAPNGREIAKAILNLNVEDARKDAYRFHERAPFAVTSFMTALDMATGHPLLNSATALKVPVLAIISESEPGPLATEVDGLLARGYRTLKFKVGFDVRADLEALATLQSVVAGRANIRVDANQGYSVGEAVAFLSEMSPQDIELLEQPCAAGDWDAAEEVAKHAHVPLMLDESIFGVEDIRRAADLGCASFIKLKLMKLCSLDKLCEGLALIRELGMEPVLGNGVASDIGCWMEACVAARYVENAGEMNGFLKPVSPVFDLPLRVEDGCLHVDPGKAIVPDRDEIDRHTLEHATFPG